MRFKTTIFACLAMMFVWAALVPAQEINNGTSTGTGTLKDRETCKVAPCSCGSPAINVPVACECQIDGPSGTGTSHCSAVTAGTNPLYGSILWGILGLSIGAGLTYMTMRRRT